MKLEIDLKLEAIIALCVTVFICLGLSFLARESLTKIEAEHQLSLARISIEQASLIRETKTKGARK